VTPISHWSNQRSFRLTARKRKLDFNEMTPLSQSKNLNDSPLRKLPTEAPRKRHKNPVALKCKRMRKVNDVANETGPHAVKKKLMVWTHWNRFQIQTYLKRMLGFVYEVRKVDIFSLRSMLTWNYVDRRIFTSFSVISCFLVFFRNFLFSWATTFYLFVLNGYFKQQQSTRSISMFLKTNSCMTVDMVVVKKALTSIKIWLIGVFSMWFCNMFQNKGDEKLTAMPMLGMWVCVPVSCLFLFCAVSLRQSIFMWLVSFVLCNKKHEIISEHTF